MNPFNKFMNWLRNLPNKKHHVEFLTAILSVPVLLTVVYMNYLSIQEKRKEDLQKPSPTQSIVTIIREKDDSTPVPTQSDKECEAGIGDVTIVSPEEDTTVNDNPLNIDIEYQKGDFCSVVWSYRINSSTWSEYSDRDIVIYNMPSGAKTLELRVKSIVSGEEKKFDRIFTYINTQEVPTPTAAPSVTNTPSPTSVVTTP